MKHLKLIAFLAVAMMAQPALAGSKMDKVKKVGKCGWHTLKLVTAWKLGVITFTEDFSLDNEKGDYWCFGGAALLFASGVHGLNKELGVTKGVKKGVRKVFKRKK